MSSLFVSLLNASNTMRLFQRGMDTVSNNVSNASTPGYAKQKLLFRADRFEPGQGLGGGVSSFGVADSRDPYSEESVRREMVGLGYSQQKTDSLARIEPVLDVSAGSGISASLDKLLQAFSAAAVAPNEGTAREVILQRAGQLARGFQQASANLTNAAYQTDRTIKDTIQKLNLIGGQLRDLNDVFRADFRNQKDAGLNAQLTSTLEDLAQITDATVLRQEDGTVSVYLGGQTLFVMGEKLYPVHTDTVANSPAVLDVNGRDVTDNFKTGRLGGLLDMRSSFLPQLQSDLDRLAQSVAENFNSTLAGGVDQNGQQPTKGLFTFDAATGVARTLAVSDLSGAELALAGPDAPGGNANALALTRLGDTKILDGATFTEFYGGLAARVGRELATSREDQRIRQSLTDQARTLRDNLSKVNLDEEAITLIEFQRAFQATAKVINTLDSMTETLLGIIR